MATGGLLAPRKTTCGADVAKSMNVAVAMVYSPIFEHCADSHRAVKLARQF